MKAARRRWLKWGLAGVFGVGALLVIGLSVGASFLITNSRFSFPERVAADPSELGADVEDVELHADDGVSISSWWKRGQPSAPAIVFVHGLNRSRVELLDRATEAASRGYGVMMIDLRNHGRSGRAYTTLGVDESRDVCAAAGFVRERDPRRAVAVWGVSLGAASALLAGSRCPDRIQAVIADSSFLSIDETIGHHLWLLTRLPAFPIADLIVAITSYRMGFSAGDGDVEAAVASRPDLPIQFIAGDADVRMPLAIERRLRDASANPESGFLVVEGAGHGRAFETAPETYRSTVFAFLERTLPDAPPTPDPTEAFGR